MSTTPRTPRSHKEGLPALRPCSVVLEPLTPKANTEFSVELKKAINERNLLTTKTRKRVTDALDQLHNEATEGNRRIRKQRILAEIVESEENYIQQLETIIKFFLKPVKEKDLLQPETFSTLFGNVESIYKINKELLDELKRGPTNVSKAFSKIAPFFKAYSFYAFEFKHTLEILQSCHKDNPKFAKFLENQESRPEVQCKLSALLIAPIQRVPRYKLLIKPLLDLTPFADPEYDLLSDSLQKIENAAEHINKVLKERENTQRLLELQRCLQDDEFNIVAPGRSLIKEGPLKRISAKDGRSAKAHIVLMNDIVVIFKMKQPNLKPKSLKCSFIFPLNKCKVSELLDKGAFRLTCDDKEVVLYHKSLLETKRWIEEIRHTIETLIEDRKTLKKEYTLRIPAAKRKKELCDYNELGISPGKKLKKKRNPLEEETTTASPNFTLTCRRPLRNSMLPMITLNPPPERSPSLKTNYNGQSKTETTSTELVPSNEIFVFGRANPGKPFSFKVNNWFCGFGSSVKKFFGLGNNNNDQNNSS